MPVALTTFERHRQRRIRTLFPQPADQIEHRLRDFSRCGTPRKLENPSSE
ncbi:hypothetical protein [Streptomyces tubercidicus]|uniref:Uncharacterized protein n=1 Tax=Streptomyces tubercidicus TaxID=47759 RepID=A0A640UII4_9ACTN|nr:hypothetical protein [Streptomyces tubercidicus]WAU10707.1 hypothetical protein STRTU_000820 [Streptomyces tubercidicus]GFE35858.1 hypothetical protein Stube_05310 [Streptomyces tubercidicus]